MPHPRLINWLMGKTFGGLTLALAEREALETLILKHGEIAVRARMQVSRQAFMRALAGLPVRLGTAVLIRTGLAAFVRASAAHP
jgi:hypothetical protein